MRVLRDFPDQKGDAIQNAASELLPLTEPPQPAFRLWNILGKASTAPIPPTFDGIAGEHLTPTM